jgi:hypothetical protein
MAGRLPLRYILAAYCLAFDNARVERQTINTGRRWRRFSRLSSLISRLPRFGVLPDFHASIVRLTFETRKPLISAAPRTVAKLTFCETKRPQRLVRCNLFRHGAGKRKTNLCL